MKARIATGTLLITILLLASATARGAGGMDPAGPPPPRRGLRRRLTPRLLSLSVWRIEPTSSWPGKITARRPIIITGL
jgi:hypothetical protein